MAIPAFAQMALMTGLSLAAKKLIGSRPDPEEFLPSDSLTDRAGSVAREQLRDAATLAKSRQEQGAADLRASGVTGSGVSASLAPIFQSNNRLYSGILSNLAERQLAAEASELAYKRNLGEFLLGRADQIYQNRGEGAASMLDTAGLGLSSMGGESGGSLGLSGMDVGSMLPSARRANLSPPPLSMGTISLDGI